MKRNRQTRIWFPVFNNYEVRVILARDVKATGRRLRERLDDAEAAFITHEDHPGIGWLVFGMNPCAGTVAHEASHAIADLFRFSGARRDEEIYAYHLDYLVGRIHKFLKTKV